MTSFFMPTRRTLLRAAVVASGLFVAACEPVSLGQSGTATGPQIAPGETVPVALLVPGNTSNADLDRLGRSLANAARMAAADAKGAKLDLRIYPTAPSDAEAVAAANKAVDNGAKIILGPLFADSANAVGAAMRDKNINVVSFSNNTEIAGGNVFVMGNTFDNVADRLIGYGKKQGKGRILVVAEDDLAGQIGARAIEKAIAHNGATMAGKITHAVSEAGIDSVIPTVVDVAKKGKADAIFLTANQQAVLPYVTNALNGQGVTSATTQMMGLTRWDVPAARLQLPGVQGGWFAMPDQRLKAQFEARYKAAYGEMPHEMASLGYDAVAAIGALVSSGSKNALTSTGLTRKAGFTGVGGVFRFKADGTNERGLSVATIRDGKVVILDPAPVSFGGLTGFGF